MASIKIPAEFVPRFKVAAAIMVSEDAGRIQQEAETVREAVTWRKPEVAAARKEDLESAERGLTEAARVLVATFDAAAATPEADISIDGDAGEISWILGALVEKVFLPELTSVANGRPLDSGEITTLTEAVIWATDKAADLEDVAVEDQAARRERQVEQWTESTARRAEIEVDLLRNFMADAEERGMARASFMGFCRVFFEEEGDNPEPGMWARLSKALNAQLGEAN